MQQIHDLNKVLDSLPLAQLLPGNARPEGRDSEACCSNLQSAYLGVHSSETFPHSRAPICSLIGDFEQGRVKGGLQAKVSLLLKSHIPNEFPLIFRRRFRILALDQSHSPLLDKPIRGTFLLYVYYIYILYIHIYIYICIYTLAPREGPEGPGRAGPRGPGLIMDFLIKVN